MFYPTQLDDQTTLYLEAETSGAFAKSDLEDRPDPLNALTKAVTLAEKLSRHIAEQMKPFARDHGSDAVMTFSIRCDSHGSVMVAQDTDRGQLKCTLTIRP